MCNAQRSLCCRTDCCKREDHTMLYRCTSLARRSRAALQHQGQGQHGGRGSEKTSSVIHRHSRQAWVAAATAALQQLLIHVLECTRVAQRKGGVETPKSRASIAPEQTSEHSPRVQHLVDLTTRQSGRKDTRTGTYPTRFSLQAKSIRKTDADRIYNTHRHGKVPAPPEICEKSRKKKKSDHREGLCDNQKKKKHPIERASDRIRLLCRGLPSGKIGGVSHMEGRTCCTDQIEYGEIHLNKIKSNNKNRSAERHVEVPHASVRSCQFVNSQVWKQAPEPRARSATYLAMPRRQRGGV